MLYVALLVIAAAGPEGPASPSAGADAPAAPPTPPAALVGAAVQASETGKFCDALALFTALNERWPSERAIYNAAEVAYAAGDRVRALDLYREAQRLYPTFEKRDAVQKRADEVFKTMVKSGPGTACPVVPPACGDWRVVGKEQCDDGNTKDGDGCDSNCAPTGRGNGVKTGDEQCDDGNLVDGDGCDSNATRTACGNGVKTPGEQCDDSNRDDGDGCDHDCTITACGNGVRTDDEQCDDGNHVDGDGCDRGCLVSACGNGVRAPTESCDDGNVTSGDGCDATCSISRRAAPIPGLITVGVGVLGLAGSIGLASIGLESWFAHEQAVDEISASETAFNSALSSGDADAQSTALASAEDAQAREQATRNEWQSGGVLTVGTAGALGLVSTAVVAFGAWWALTATEEVTP